MSGREGLSLSAKALRTHESSISYLIATSMANPGLINLAAGLVDEPTLPVTETGEIARKIFSDVARGTVALQYDTTLGMRQLRQRLVAHLEELEGKSAASMGFGADDVIVTTGSQQALYLIGDVLIDPGDIVIAANPSYFVYAGALASLGARVEAVPMDEDGMDVAAVARKLAEIERAGELSRVKLIYCTSYFQNPTGLTLAAERRPELLRLAREYSRAHRILILEDAAYRELEYGEGMEREEGATKRRSDEATKGNEEGTEARRHGGTKGEDKGATKGVGLASIKSFDAENKYTILANTFSKPFAPGIKTGYTVMPRDLLHAVVQQKGNHDFGSANLCQQIALEALASGAYAKHVEVLKAAYRKKRDTLLGAMEDELAGTGALWTRPGGGLYSWVTLPDGCDTSRKGEIFGAAVEAGVLYVPGDYCYQPDAAGWRPTNHMRLSFGQVKLNDIEEGVARLARVLRPAIARGGRQAAAGTTA